MKRIELGAGSSLDPWPSLSDAISAMLLVLIFVIVALVISNRETINAIIEQSKTKELDAEIREKVKEPIEQELLEVEREVDRVIITFNDEVLFEPGKADLKPTGEAVLRIVGEAFQGLTGDSPVRGGFAVLEDLDSDALLTRVQVEGHTDNVPIRTPQFKSNWELSTARATEVVHFLIDDVKLDPVLLSAAGLAEHHPIDTNETPEGRRRNRRVEMILFAE